MIGATPNTLVNTLHGSGAPEPHWTDVADMTQGFHTYAVDWEPDKITWYFDGQQTFETPTTPDMNQPMYVLATTDTGLSGSWPGATDPSLVSQMKIDYIRVYDSNPYTSGGALTASTDSTNAPASPAISDSVPTATIPTPPGDTSAAASTSAASTPDVSGDNVNRHHGRQHWNRHVVRHGVTGCVRNQWIRPQHADPELRARQ